MPRQRLWKVRARRGRAGDGAIERPLVFVNNDLPGIMLAGAAQAYVTRYAVRPGSRAVIFTNNDSAYAAAVALKEAGIAITAIVEARGGTHSGGGALPPARHPDPAGPRRDRRLGRPGLREVTVAPINGAGTGLAGAASTLGCDLLCVSGGWSPTVHLFSQSGGKLRLRRRRAPASFRENPCRPSARPAPPAAASASPNAWRKAMRPGWRRRGAGFAAPASRAAARGARDDDAAAAALGGALRSRAGGAAASSSICRTT